MSPSLVPRSHQQDIDGITLTRPSALVQSEHLVVVGTI